ncbi:MAG: flagellar hook assembly protein FlgD [bacterium]
MSVNNIFGAPSTAASTIPSASSTSSQTAAPSNMYGSASASGNSNLISESSFMNLMVKELQNQNPLQPMSNTQFISELAQFNSMNELSTMNTSISSLVSSENQAAMGSAVNLVGKTVQANGNSLQYGGSGTVNLAYSLPQNSANTSMDIYNSSGNLVYNTNLGTETAGSQSFGWNGMTNSGIQAPQGNYSFSVNASDSSGNSITAQTMGGGTVTGITSSSSGAVELELNNGTTVPLSSVKGIS